MKKLKVIIYFLVLLPLLKGNIIAQNTNKISLIIDADTANEVDDLFAIIRAINASEFDLLGITSAQFHTSPYASEKTANESQKINEDIINILQKKEIPLPLGSNHPLKSVTEAQPSQAANFIIKKAHQMPKGNKLNLVILGSCTNVASAILLDPTIVDKIKVHYLGFWHNPETNTYNKKEFNSGNDTIAVNYLLDHSKLDLSVMTATTSQHLVFYKNVVDLKLKNKNKIGNYLVNRWETYKRWWTKEDPLQTKWTMWDVAIIEALAHPEWTTLKNFKTPPENTQREIKIYTKIDTKKMETDFWDHIQKLSN